MGALHSEACVQAGPVAAVTVATKMISDTLVRMEQQQERTASALETIAEQGADIQNIKEQQIRDKESLDKLFKRVRDVEIQAAAERVRISFIIAGAATATSAVTAAMIKLLT